MDEILDIDKYPRSQMLYGGHAGKKRSVSIFCRNWMIKYPQNTRDNENIDVSYTTSPLSEYIGSHVYEILGFPVHRTRLGVSEGKLVVACQDYTDDLPVKTGLLRIYDMQQLVNDDLGKNEAGRDSVSSSDRTHGADLGELLYTLDHHPMAGRAFRERFWNMFVVDALISNSDRHNGNWGFYTGNGRDPHLLPVYDNGNCLLAKHSEEKITQILDSQDRYNSILNSGNSAFIYMDKKVDLLTTVKNLGITKKEKNADLIRAVCHVVPLIHKKMPRIQEFLDGIPKEYEGISIISAARRALYKKILTDRQEHILEPALIKAKEYAKQQQLSKAPRYNMDLGR